MGSQSTLDRTIITDIKVMTWTCAAANEVSNLAATSELLEIGFTGEFNNPPPPGWAWSDFWVLANQRRSVLGLVRRYFKLPTTTQSAIWNAIENDSRTRTWFSKPGPLSNMIIPASDTPHPTTASPSLLSSADPETRVQTRPKFTLSLVPIPAIPQATKIKEVEMTASGVRDWTNIERLKLGSDRFIIIQPTMFAPTAPTPAIWPATQIPVGFLEHNEEITDSVSRPPTGHESPPPQYA